MSPTSQNTTCKLVELYEVDRGPKTSWFVQISLFFYVSSLVFWIFALAWFWAFRFHSRLKFVRPFNLNFILVICQILWATLCLNLAVDTVPCVFVPFSIIIGMSGMAVNYFLRIIVFTIESQFAKNAHLLRIHSHENSSTASSSATLPVTFFRSFFSLLKLLFGVSTLQSLPISHLANVRTHYATLSILTMLPGIIPTCIILILNPVYISCSGCAVYFDVLIAYFVMACTYVFSCFRITFVLWKEKFPDTKGIFRELLGVLLFVGIPLIVASICWICDPNQSEYKRDFAYEWVFQIFMSGLFWHFSVWEQVMVVAFPNCAFSPPSTQQDPQTIGKLGSFSSDTLENSEFEQYCVSMFTVENIYFLRDVRQYLLLFFDRDAFWREKKAKLLCQTYIVEGSSMQINISDSLRREIISIVFRTEKNQSTNKLYSVFDEATHDIEKSVLTPIWQAWRDQKLEMVLSHEPGIIKTII